MWFFPLLLIILGFIISDSTFSTLCFVAGFFTFFIILIMRSIPPPPEISCPVCKYSGPAVKTTKGSMSMEIVLWILFIIPGLIYSLWRLSTRATVCPKCSNPNVIKQPTNN